MRRRGQDGFPVELVDDGRQVSLCQDVRGRWREHLGCRAEQTPRAAMAARTPGLAGLALTAVAANGIAGCARGAGNVADLAAGGPRARFEVERRTVALIHAWCSAACARADWRAAATV